MSRIRDGIWSSAHDSKLEIDFPTDKSDRIAYIDSARGILIILMLVVHSATPCTESIRYTIQGMWILDIATKGFVMMAGYTLAMVYNKARPPAFGKLLRRSIELLVVMFCSNIVLTLARLGWAHELEATVTWPWLLGLLTLKTQYNISGVLLPIALLLPLMFFILQMEHRWGLVVTVSSVVVSLIGVYLWLSLGTHGALADNFVEVGFIRGAGGFPVVPYISYGFLGFLTARFIHGRPYVEFDWMKVTILVLVASVLYMAISFTSQPNDALSFFDPVILLIKYLRAEAMFLLILAFGVAASLMYYSTNANTPLNILGHYALLAFVLHRLIGHASIIALNLHDGGYSTFVFQFSLVLILTYLICFLRTRMESLDHFFSKLFL